MALLVCSALHAEQLRYRLDRSRIEPGERVSVEIHLPKEWLAFTDSAPEMNDAFFSLAPGIQVLESDSGETETAYVWRYQLTAYEVGPVTIPPVEIRVGPLSFSTESTPLEVVTTRPPGDAEMREAFGPISEPFRWDLWLRLLAWMAVAAVLYFVARRYLIPRLRSWLAGQGARRLAYRNRESDRAWLRRQLARIRGNMERGESPELWMDDLTDVLREYYGRVHRRPVRAWTTREIEKRLPDDESARKLSRAVLAACDEIKFAGKRNSTAAPEVARQCLAKSEEILLKAL